MSLVLDSSATLAWIYAEGTTNAVRHLFDIVAEDGAVVPAVRRLEVANSLTVAARRGRIDVEFRNAALADLAWLDITTDPPAERCVTRRFLGSRQREAPAVAEGGAHAPTHICIRNGRLNSCARHLERKRRCGCRRRQDQTRSDVSPGI
jgi:predicted nucleic acid-binding protein